MNIIQEALQNLNSIELNETSRKNKAKRVLTNPKYMSHIATMAIFTANNPNRTKASKEDNIKFNDDLEKTLKTMTDRGFQFYKVKGSYGDVERSYIVYNISLEDSKDICKKFGQQSFIFIRNNDGKLTFEMWANASRNSYVYKKVDERDSYVMDNNFEDFYTQISRDFKFNIPFEIFDVAPEDMVEEMERMCDGNENYRDHLQNNIEESIDDSKTYKSRMLARSRLYGKMKNDFNEE